MKNHEELCQLVIAVKFCDTTVFSFSKYFISWLLEVFHSYLFYIFAFLRHVWMNAFLLFCELKDHSGQFLKRKNQIQM